jgi:hypothetical protein
MTKKIKTAKDEQGVAMLVAMMALVLLAILGMGFMFMADTENSVNNNYRDSQKAYFASRAGLENMRVLLASGPLSNQVTNMDGVMPTGAGGVLYVYNPTGTEGISPTSGDYVDDELCQEQFSALNTSLGYTSVTPGVPCAAPNTSAYFTTATGLNVNSSNPAASDIPYTQTASALPFKWVRITNKQNLMGLVGPASAKTTVDGTTSSANYGLQVCFNGTNEVTIPAGQKCTAQLPQLEPVWLLTSMAMTPRLGNRPGSKRVTQMELALSPPLLPPGVVSTEAPLLFHGSSVNVDAMDNCSCNPKSCTTDTNGVTTCSARATGGSCNANHVAAFTAGTVSTNGNPTATTAFGNDLTDATGTATTQNVSPWPYNVDQLINSYKSGATMPSWAPSCSGTANFTAVPPTYLTCGTQSGQTFGGYPGMDSTGAITSPPPTFQTTYVPGSVQLTSNATGAGVLIIDGDLDIHGGLNFYGLILVRGQVTFSGGGSSGTNLYGAILAGGDVTNVVKSIDDFSTDSIGGNVNLQYDVCALSKSSGAVAPRLLATHEIQY